MLFQARTRGQAQREKEEEEKKNEGVRQEVDKEKPKKKKKTRKKKEEKKHSEEEEEEEEPKERKKKKSKRPILKGKTHSVGWNTSYKHKPVGPERSLQYGLTERCAAIRISQNGNPYYTSFDKLPLNVLKDILNKKKGCLDERIEKRARKRRKAPAPPPSILDPLTNAPESGLYAPPGPDQKGSVPPEGKTEEKKAAQEGKREEESVPAPSLLDAILPPIEGKTELKEEESVTAPSLLDAILPPKSDLKVEPKPGPPPATVPQVFLRRKREGKIIEYQEGLDQKPGGKIKVYQEVFEEPKPTELKQRALMAYQNITEAPRSPRELGGCNIGALAWQNNSCYVDSVLMAMFAVPHPAPKVLFIDSIEDKETNVAMEDARDSIQNLGINHEVVRKAHKKCREPELNNQTEFGDAVAWFQDFCTKFEVPKFMIISKGDQIRYQHNYVLPPATNNVTRTISELLLSDTKKRIVPTDLMVFTRQRTNGSVIPNEYLFRCTLTAVVMYRGAHYTAFLRCGDRRYNFYDDKAIERKEEIKSYSFEEMINRIGNSGRMFFYLNLDTQAYRPPLPRARLEIKKLQVVSTEAFLRKLYENTQFPWDDKGDLVANVMKQHPELDAKVVEQYLSTLSQRNYETALEQFPRIDRKIVQQRGPDSVLQTQVRFFHFEQKNPEYKIIRDIADKHAYLYCRRRLEAEQFRELSERKISSICPVAAKVLLQSDDIDNNEYKEEGVTASSIVFIAVAFPSHQLIAFAFLSLLPRNSAEIRVFCAAPEARAGVIIHGDATGNFLHAIETVLLETKKVRWLQVMVDDFSEFFWYERGFYYDKKTSRKQDKFCVGAKTEDRPILLYKRIK